MVKFTLSDLFIILIIIALLFSLVAFIRFTLFRDEHYHGTLRITSRPLPTELAQGVSVGDEVFDCITKRRIGRISSAVFKELDGTSIIELTVDAERKIKSGAIRTRELYIELNGDAVYE